MKRKLRYFWKSNNRCRKLDVQEANVSVHSSTEPKVISVDAGLRMDGILALDLCDVVLVVLHSSNNKKSSTQEVSWKQERIQGDSGKLHAHG